MCVCNLRDNKQQKKKEEQAREIDSYMQSCISCIFCCMLRAAQITKVPLVPAKTKNTTYLLYILITVPQYSLYTTLYTTVHKCFVQCTNSIFTRCMQPNHATCNQKLATNNLLPFPLLHTATPHRPSKPSLFSPPTYFHADHPGPPHLPLR